MLVISTEQRYFGTPVSTQCFFFQAICTQRPPNRPELILFERIWRNFDTAPGIELATWFVTSANSPTATKTKNWRWIHYRRKLLAISCAWTMTSNFFTLQWVFWVYREKSLPTELIIPIFQQCCFDGAVSTVLFRVSTVSFKLSYLLGGGGGFPLPESQIPSPEKHPKHTQNKNMHQIYPPDMWLPRPPPRALSLELTLFVSAVLIVLFR